MHQIAILNYATCRVEIVSIEPETWQRYADDLDTLVYEVWGYKSAEVSYMSGENGIGITRMTETEVRENLV